MATTAPTPRTRIARLPERGAYDRETIYGILDSAFFCHVGFVADGQPMVIPTLYGRRGDRLYIHGSAASRMLRGLKGGLDCCVTVTILDGLVLARSAFHHSANYRSVVVLGRATAVDEEGEKVAALEIISENVVPGRWRDVRPPSAQELKATQVLSLGLEEASAKIRRGPPKDEAEDYALPVWAGVVPARLSFGEPEPDPALTPGIPVPATARR
ncbi:MAG: pyridoxamine 5'-phosphate oxidase family protein [Terriglobales bacterium]